MNPNIRLGIADALSEHFGIAHSAALDTIPEFIHRDCFVDCTSDCGHCKGNSKSQGEWNLYLLGVRIGMFAPKRSGAIRAVIQRRFAYNYAKSEFQNDRHRLYRIEKETVK